MESVFYQFCANDGTPLDVAVDQLQAPSERLTRQKPVTGWITQAASSSKSALVLWTWDGAHCYLKSGLLGWQCAMLAEEVIVRKWQLLHEPQFEDDHQIVTSRDNVKLIGEMSLKTFLDLMGYKNYQNRTICYITRSSHSDPAGELMVLQKKSGPAARLPNVAGATGKTRELGGAVHYDTPAKEFHFVRYTTTAVSDRMPTPAPQNRDEESTWVPVKSARRVLSREESCKLSLLSRENSRH